MILGAIVIPGIKLPGSGTVREKSQPVPALQSFF